MSIVFHLNIPAEYVHSNRTDVHVLVKTHKFLNRTIETDFIDLNTQMVCMVKDWQSVFAIAHACSVKQWEARENAKAIGDLQVTKDGEIISSPINKD